MGENPVLVDGCVGGFRLISCHVVQEASLSGWRPPIGSPLRMG
jgi:hypothetical protein